MAASISDRELLSRIARSSGGKAGYKQLVRELGLGGGRERRLLLEQLARLTARGELVKVDRELWGIPRAVTGTASGSDARSGTGSRETRDNLAAGRLDLHRDGYGFVRPNARQASGVTEDIFIPPDEINGAMQGDQVLVELAPPRGDGRRMGRIARVLTRRNTTVVGTFRYSKSERANGNLVIPFDERMTQPILIPFGAEIPKESEETAPHRVLGEEALAAGYDNGVPDNLDGLVVDVEITSWPTPTKPAMGRVIEILGDPEDFGVDVEIMIRKHQLPRVFPENVLAEARRVAHLDLDEVARRRDFRGLPIVTIDGETARDFDDAVLVRKRADGGYELQVHIADVAEYVRGPGDSRGDSGSDLDSDLDLEARLRGTSVYFPDRAIPMLPQELSTDICSLRPKEDRLVLSCLMQLDANGNIERYEICEGVIRSAARMTYTKVHLILEGDEETRAEYPELTADFERMQQLAWKMNKRREERGSIDFDLPEPVIQFDEQGQMRGVTKAERTWANRLIEEFMLAANECVATWLEDLGVPSLYRIHERPEPRRVVEFEEQAAGFGFSLGLGPLPVKRIQTRGDRREAERSGRRARTHEVAEEIPVTPKMYQRLAARIEGKPEERILSYLMLRSLRQARYSETNEGHFALAAPTYTHFTSPIRRYPDLIVHRITKALLRRGVSGKGTIAEGRLESPWTHPNEGMAGIMLSHPSRKNKDAARVGHPADSLLEPVIPEAELAQIADETSQTERRAAEAERELVEWKKVRFMQDRVGEEFAALVLNPTKYGLFVELIDLFVEGLVPIDSLRDDRYTWRENTHEIVGERWGRKFRAGERVQVILDRILAQERKLQFSIVQEGIPLTGLKARKMSSATKSRKSAKKKNKDGTPRELPPAPKRKKPKHPHRKGKRR
jgi:ribonuclease R